LFALPSISYIGTFLKLGQWFQFHEILQAATSHQKPHTDIFLVGFHTFTTSQQPLKYLPEEIDKITILRSIDFLIPNAKIGTPIEEITFVRIRIHTKIS